MFLCSHRLSQSAIMCVVRYSRFEILAAKRVDSRMHVENEQRIASLLSSVKPEALKIVCAVVNLEVATRG